LVVFSFLAATLHFEAILTSLGATMNHNDAKQSSWMPPAPLEVVAQQVRCDANYMPSQIVFKFVGHVTHDIFTTGALFVQFLE